MATVTLGNAGQAGYIHAGLNVKVCKVSLSVTWSDGDVHIIGYLPDGAVPVEAVFYPGAAAPTGFIARFGTSASQEMFFASDSWAESGTMRYTSVRKLGEAMKIACNDSDAQREALIMLGKAALTAGYYGDLVVYYTVGTSN